MHDALGPPGRARRIHPERHLVAVGVGLREIGGETLQPCVGDDGLRHGVIAAAPLTTISVRNGVSLQASAVEAGQNSASATATDGAGIDEIELQQVRRRQRVDQERHEACAHRAEKRRRIGRRVVKKHQDAVAALQSERLKAVAPLRGFGAKLGIAARAGGPDQRGTVAAALARDCRTECGWHCSVRGS